MNAHSHLQSMYEHLLHTGPVPRVFPAGQPMGWIDIIAINRKMLADLAINDAPAFAQLVEKARAAL